MTNFDPVYRWSLPGETEVGSQQTNANIGGRDMHVIQNAGMAAMTFSFDDYAYTRADRLDVSATDTLKMTVFQDRSDRSTWIRAKVRQREHDK